MIKISVRSEAEAAGLRVQVEAERRNREAVERQAQINFAEAREEVRAAPSPAAAPRAAARKAAEIGTVLDALLPRVKLLPRSMDAIHPGWTDLRALYRVLGELESCSAAKPPKWKTVQDAEAWIEKSKVSNGQDDGGRVYARLDRADHSWAVLVGHKAEQHRDIQWLKRN